MTDEEKWKSVIESNVDSDGKFFYAVRTTKFFADHPANQDLR